MNCWKDFGCVHEQTREGAGNGKFADQPKDQKESRLGIDQNGKESNGRQKVRKGSEETATNSGKDLPK